MNQQQLFFVQFQKIFNTTPVATRTQQRHVEQNTQNNIQNNRQAKWITKLGHAPTETYSRVYTEWIILLVHCITNKLLLYFVTMFGGTFGGADGNCTSYTKRSAFDRWVSLKCILDIPNLT